MQKPIASVEEFLRKLDTAGKGFIDPSTVKGIIKSLREMAASDCNLDDLATFYWCDENDVEGARLWALYDEAVAEIRREWGAPEFSGLGPRGGGERTRCKEGLPEFHISALHLNCWLREDFMWTVMVTGHDADTVYCLQLAASPIQGRAEDAARAVLTVLRVRGIVVPDAARGCILAEKDPARLERWQERAGGATSIAEVIDEPS